MRARHLWLPLGAFVALAAALGGAQGLRLSAQGETPMITAMAARYVADAGAGAQPTDCAARPSAAPLGWLAIRCTGPRGTGEYHVNRLGWLVREIRPTSSPIPET